MIVLMTTMIMMTMTRLLMMRMARMMMTIIQDHDKDDFSDEVCGTNWQLWDSLTNISHPPAHVSVICYLHDNVDEYIDDHHRHDYNVQ